MRAFDKFIAIDWSGAGTEDDGVDIGVAKLESGRDIEVATPAGARRTRWKRRELRDYLHEALHADQPRTLVAVDAGLSLAYGSASAIVDELDAEDWRALTAHLAALYGDYQTAHATAEAVNARFEDSGRGAPFRFNHNRTDPRFYVDHRVGYFRQVELFCPQAISEFYMGSGAKVGFHTITFLAALDALMDARASDSLNFSVWLHEVFDADDAHHLICECFPSLFDAQRRDVEQQRPSLNDHQRDAVACLQWLRDVQRRDELAGYLTPRQLPAGRRADCSWREQLAFEGWILGVPWR